jgi:hypothetical protein
LPLLHLVELSIFRVCACKLNISLIPHSYKTNPQEFVIAYSPPSRRHLDLSIVLINSVLSSLPMFMLSFLQIPVGVRKRLDFYRSRFFWQSDENKRKYRLTKWNIVCRPKDQVGSVLKSLRLKINVL